MAKMQTSGAISLKQIHEFHPYSDGYSMRDCFRPYGILDIDDNDNVPYWSYKDTDNPIRTTDAVSFSDFYGTHTGEWQYLAMAALTTNYFIPYGFIAPGDVAVDNKIHRGSIYCDSLRTTFDMPAIDISVRGDTVNGRNNLMAYPGIQIYHRSTGARIYDIRCISSPYPPASWPYTTTNTGDLTLTGDSLTEKYYYSGATKVVYSPGESAVTAYKPYRSVTTSLTGWFDIYYVATGYRKTTGNSQFRWTSPAWEFRARPR